MHALVRDPELPREFSLRDASGISGADEGIALLSGESFVTRRGVGVYDFESGAGKTPTILWRWSGLRPQRPFHAQSDSWLDPGQQAQEVARCQADDN